MHDIRERLSIYVKLQFLLVLIAICDPNMLVSDHCSFSFKFGLNFCRVCSCEMKLYFFMVSN